MTEHDDAYGAPVPTYGNMRWWHVWHCRTTTPEPVLVLSERIYGQWFHWTGNDNIPCTMRAGCLLCERADPNRWKGYVAARVGSAGKEAVWTFSAHSARMVLPIIEERGSARGLEILFKREAAKQGQKQRINAKVLATVQRTLDPLKIPPAFPVVFSIHRLFGVLSDRRQDVQQQPPRVMDPYQPPRFDYNSIPLTD